MDYSAPLLDERPRMFRGDPIKFIVALILIPIVIGIVAMLVLWLRSIGERISISDRFILVERGILNKDRTETPIAGVRAINIRQSFIDRIFNVGRIEIYTTGDEPEATIAGIAAPNRVRDIVRRQQGVIEQAAGKVS
jgi:uncharacterized membrane protein YdbT with pleckstrin-like domain